MASYRRIYTHRITAADPEVAGRGGAELFPYWSFTKIVIAICALRMMERGALDLDAPVRGQAFTLRQLLDHTAGLPDYGSLEAYGRAVAKDDEPWSAEALFERTMAQGTRFQPGAGWSYSNLGYMLARGLIEERAGRPFAAIVKEEVCDVLGLASVELATTRDQFRRVLWKEAQHYHPGWVYHGCLIGTVADAARLLHGLFAGKLLEAATLEQMLVRHPLGGAIAGRPWTECGYALGLMSGRFGDAGRAIGHSGGGPFSVNAVYHFPDLREPVTVASFAHGQDVGVAEFAAADCAAGE